MFKYTPANLACFFFDFKDAAKQDVLSLLSSLIVQISRTLDRLPEALQILFQRHSVRDPDRPTSPTVWELVQALTAVIAIRDDFYIVIDALDECSQRPLLLEMLETMVILVHNGSSRCRLLYTSRAEVDIQRAFTKLRVTELPIQNQNFDHDVALYVRSVLESDDRLQSHRQGIKDLIAETLTKGARGM